VHCIEWQTFPTMAVNSAFVAEAEAAVTAMGADKTTPILFLCRSGARSRATAVALAAQGFSQAFNVAGGFEGDPDGERHRGNINGWKAAGLPWRQG
jgi:rhodanese-related sulfurtransferase